MYLRPPNRLSTAVERRWYYLRYLAIFAEFNWPISLASALIAAFACDLPSVYAQKASLEISNYSQVLKDGRYLLSLKRLSEAAVCFEKYANRYPNDPVGFFYLGLVADDAGDLKRAASLYIKCLNLAKSAGMDSEELRLNLGNTLLKLNYLKEAIFDYQRAIEINDKNFQAHLNLSKAYLLNSEYDKALDQLRICNDLKPEEKSLSMLRALALKNSGHLDESKREAAKYLENSDFSSPKLKKTVLDLF